MQKKILTIYYDWASPPARAVMAFAKMAKVSNVNFQEIRLGKYEHYSEEFKKISDFVTVPAIKEEDGKKVFTLCESHAIIRYLAQSRPDEVSDHFYSRTDHQQRARIDQFLDWHHTNLREGASRIVFKKYFSILKQLKRQYKEEEIKSTEDVLFQSLNFLEKSLQKQSFICSRDKLSVADIVATSDLAQLKFLIKADEYLNGYPKVQEWHSKMMDIPEIKEVHQVLFKLIEESQKKNARYLL